MDRILAAKTASKDSEEGRSAVSDRIKFSLLYDYYGELLGERNREIFEGYVLDDLSLSELAESMDVSRQAIRDSVNRSKKQLLMYEKCLQVEKKTEEVLSHMEEIERLVKAYRIAHEPDKDLTELLDKIEKHSGIVEDIL